MKNKTTIALFFTLLTAVVSAPAIAATSSGYLNDSYGNVVRSGFSGDCWRSILWSPSNALAECEGKASDSDNDGVVDSSDRCPNTAAGVSVDAKGCDKDSDKDGVANAYDKCPNTAAGVTVDANGCDKDADNDGIANAYDDCPNTAAGTIVNNRGCQLQDSLSLDNVQFKTGTAVLSTTSRNILDNVAQTLKKNNHLKFEVQGHTDSTGNYQNNVNLSQSRAKSVRQYLINKGVAPNSLTARGYGPDKPVASNSTRDGRSKNRRVTLVPNQ